MSFPDFSASDAQIQWQRFCDLLWYHEDLGIWLDISRMHLNPSDLEQLQPKFDKAFTAMAELEAGAIELSAVAAGTGGFIINGQAAEDYSQPSSFEGSA